MRPITLFTGQYADLSFETMCQKAKSFGYDGIEIACWGEHLDTSKANDAYCKGKLDVLRKHKLKLFAISNHRVGQAVSDHIIDERHKSILPPHVWGDGDPEGVRQRAAKEMIETGKVAKKLGLKVVNGFTGSPIWHMLYSFPPVSKEMIDKGYKDFAKRWIPILDEYHNMGMKFALEVHPTEIAFDIVSAERTLDALHHHPAFGFNYNPSHFGYQGVDYVEFIYRFAEKIFHVHIKDATWSMNPTEAGIFGGHTEFGDRRRYWDFVSPGRGNVEFEEIIRALNRINYQGPLSVEWEDSGMDREHGAIEAFEFVRGLDFEMAKGAFDDDFQS